MRPRTPRGWLPELASTPAETLAWDAARYLLDELDADAAAAFERRLGRDQAAREALAAAVDLAGALALASRDRPMPTHRRPTRAGRATLVPSRRGLVAAAAALLLMAATWSLRPSGPARPESWWVAATWADLHRGENVGPADPDVATSGEPGDADADVADVPAERPVPSWMVAAVAVVAPDPEEMGETGDAIDMDDAGTLMNERN